VEIIRLNEKEVDLFGPPMDEMLKPKKKPNPMVKAKSRTTIGPSVVVELTEHTFMRSQRGAPLLIYQEHVYRCERVREGRSYWLCIHYKHSHCTGRVILQGNNVVKESAHNHPLSTKCMENHQLEYKSLDNLKEATEWLLNFTPKSKGSAVSVHFDVLCGK
jgi:FLYWCH zinc finger domain